MHVCVINIQLPGQKPSRYCEKTIFTSCKFRKD